MHNRTIMGVVGVAMTAALALAGGPVANAAGAATSTHVDKKPARSMVTRLHQHPLQLRVKVLGGYTNQVTYLQKKTCRTCTWHRDSRQNTDSRGKVRYPLGAPAHGFWFYRVMTPERAHFRESYSQVARTFRS